MSKASTTEGSHRHMIEQKTCFFCLNECINWLSYSLRVDKNSHENLKELCGSVTGETGEERVLHFVTCNHCKETMTNEQFASHVIEYAKIESAIKNKTPIDPENLVQTSIGRQLVEHGRSKEKRKRKRPKKR